MPQPKRAVSVEALRRKKFKEMDLTQDFKKLLGTPERSGSWIVYGESGQGKSSFLMQLAKALTPFGRVAYNSLEEGARKSMQDLMNDFAMHEVSGRFVILDREQIPELMERLEKQRSPEIIIIDSVQYSFLTKAAYKEMLNRFPSKLFIFSSHAKGKEPAGAIGSAIKYDADIKIHIEGFKAFCTSRASRGTLPTPYVIWEEGAKKYWNE